VADDHQGRTLADRLFHWGRRDEDEGAGRGPAGSDKPQPTKILTKFLAALAHREALVLMDLGPVVGPNVSFFGERLSCKFLVEDLFADVERFTRENRLAELASHLGGRLVHADASVDGVLCWDLFDYLDKPSAQVLGRQIVRVLKPGGVVTGFFTTQAAPEPGYTRFVIEDDHTLVHRPYRGSRGRTLVLVNRDITLLFPGTRVVESFLLLTHTREMLLRKADLVPRPSP
jgi:hypothetical protein